MVSCDLRGAILAVAAQRLRLGRHCFRHSPRRLTDGGSEGAGFCALRGALWLLTHCVLAPFTNGCCAGVKKFHVVKSPELVLALCVVGCFKCCAARALFLSVGIFVPAASGLLC